MNKIKVVNGKVFCDAKIKWQKKDTTLQISIEESMNLELDLEQEEELTIQISLAPKIAVSLLIVQKEVQHLRFQYQLKEKSQLQIQKLDFSSTIQEQDVFELLEEDATLDFLLKTISKEEKYFDIQVEHLAKNTVSHVKNHGVNGKEGKLTFDVSGIVLKGMIGCEVDQKSRIITNNQKDCTIRPNLLVDEQDVIANHSAYIGTFSSSTLFYLMSRGLKEEDAIQLLIRGFLLQNLMVDEARKEELETMLQKVWR